jgi:polysaccharide export outer membrane protein
MYKMLKNSLILTCLLLALLSSCNNTKEFIYFNNVRDTVYSSNFNSKEYILKPNDILSITISSLNTEASAIFNPDSQQNVGRSTTVTGTPTEAGGYLISPDGNIQLPMLGTIKAAGMTKDELKKNITNLILSKKLLIDPIVEIRFLNYEVTVIGEVAHPTVITVPSEKISLLKALGLAGDLTIYGRRDNVLLIREEGGQKKTRHIDLTSANLLNSPYYYLQPNDVVYVTPNKAKIATASNTSQYLPIILSGLSVVVIVLDRLLRYYP